MTAGASRAAPTIAQQPALAPPPQPPPAPTARALPPGLVEQGGQNWTPIRGQICKPIDSLRLAKGLANPDGARIVVARGDTPFKTVEELWRRSGAKVISLEQLANADAYAGMDLGRRQAMWAVRG